jgi:hypothetical protein
MPLTTACPHTDILTLDLPHKKQEAKHLSTAFEEVQGFNKNSRN